MRHLILIKRIPLNFAARSFIVQTIYRKLHHNTGTVTFASFLSTVLYISTHHLHYLRA